MGHSIYPTAKTAQPNKCGLWLTQAPTKYPPLLPPTIVSLQELDIIFATLRICLCAHVFK